LPRGVGGTLGGAGTSATRRGRCATGARRWKGRHGRRRRGGRATAAGEGEDEPRPPERESASRGRRRGRARAAAVGICHRRGRARVAAVGICRGGRERDREKEKEWERWERDEQQLDASGCLEGIRFGTFLFCPFTFFKTIDGRGGVCIRWAGLF